MYSYKVVVIFAIVQQYILIAYFIPNSLYLLIHYPYLAPLLFPLPSGNHQLVLFICESVLVYSTSLLCFLDST